MPYTSSVIYAACVCHAEFIGHFLLNNYKQALEVIHDMPIRIATLTSEQLITDVQFTQWLEDERLYLESRKSEPEADMLAMEYVQLLQKYYDTRYAWCLESVS